MTNRETNVLCLPFSLDRARILSAKQTAEALGFSVAHLRRLYRTGKVPKPIRIAGRKIGWSAGVIADVIAHAQNEGA